MAVPGADRRNVSVGEAQQPKGAAGKGPARIQREPEREQARQPAPPPTTGRPSGHRGPQNVRDQKARIACSLFGCRCISRQLTHAARAGPDWDAAGHQVTTLTKDAELRTLRLRVIELEVRKLPAFGALRKLQRRHGGITSQAGVCLRVITAPLGCKMPGHAQSNKTN